MPRPTKREPTQKVKVARTGSRASPKPPKAKPPTRTKKAKGASRQPARATTGKKKLGRPTKRTPDAENLIIKALGVGLSYEVAADFAGIHRDTLLDWRRKDEAFSASIKGATARGKVGVAGKLMELIRAGNVAATIFWLKTRTEEFRELKQDRQVDAETIAADLEAAAKAMRGSIQGPQDGLA